MKIRPLFLLKVKLNIYFLNNTFSAFFIYYNRSLTLTITFEVWLISKGIIQS